MKKLLLLIVLIITFSCNSTKEKTQTAEISCGQFDLTSQNGCDLAVKFDEEAYFGDGFGDAHNKGTGFCEVIRTAKVSGEVINGRFKAISIELTE